MLGLIALQTLQNARSLTCKKRVILLTKSALADLQKVRYLPYKKRVKLDVRRTKVDHYRSENTESLSSLQCVTGVFTMMSLNGMQYAHMGVVETFAR